jgi:hypothetical protein
VSVQIAAVRKAPSTGSPVIGEAPRGTVLAVTRDIGAWVKVAWPDAQDGIGYVHQSMGSLSRRATLDERLAPALAVPPEPAAATTDAAAQTTGVVETSPSTRTMYVAPPTHFVGLGGRMSGSSLGGFGVTSRIWSRKRFGVQVEASRSTATSTTAPGRVTSLQFAPSLIYSLPDHVSDNVWLRPYAGAGSVLYRSTWKSGTPDIADSLPDNSFAFRTFGGAELTFPSVARFAVSADVGYSWAQKTFDGFELGGLGFSISGHWYVK